jgi:hypothetical protein
MINESNIDSLLQDVGPMLLGERVYFTVRTHDDAALDEVAARVNGMLNLSLVRDEHPRHEVPTMSTSVLGLEITLSRVESAQRDAPQRYELRAQPPVGDASASTGKAEHIESWVLYSLDKQEPGRWYAPSPAELGVDEGVEPGRIEDVWRGLRGEPAEGVRQAPATGVAAG